MDKKLYHSIFGLQESVPDLSSHKVPNLKFVIWLSIIVIPFVYFYPNQFYNISLFIISSIFFFSVLVKFAFFIFGMRDSKTLIKENEKLPIYTIMVAMYKEAETVSKIIKSISDIDYPKDKLQVLFVLEGDDDDTIKACEANNLPSYFEVVVVPDSQPKTKPKACNYALQEAKGEYVTIYDAEDIPDPQQLLKVLSVFAKSDEKLACVQSRLNWFNWNENWLSRLFSIEYSVWFDFIVNGLSKYQLLIPLGGTSNHFKTKTLKEVGGVGCFQRNRGCRFRSKDSSPWL